MAAVIIVWTFTLLLSFLFGHALLTGYQRAGGDENKQPLSFSLVVISGWALMASLGSLAYMLVPLGLGSTLFFSGCSLAYAFWQRKEITRVVSYYLRQVRQSTLIQAALFALIFFVALLFSVTPPQYYDDGLYYWQFIKWINEYAVLPGLGNLHPRLAFNSSWHLLTALLNGSFLPGGPYNDLNGLLYVVMGLYALEGLGRLQQRPFRASDAFQAGLLIPTHLIVGYFNGPSADAAVVYLVWVCLILFLRKTEAGQQRSFDREAFLILLFSTFVFTVKLSAFPLVLLPLYLVIQLLRQADIRRLLTVLGAALLIGLPWVARSVVLSGYPLYPFYQIDLFAFDWKVPAELVREEVTYIEAFAAGESLVRSYPYPEILQLSPAEWFPLWFADLRTANKAIFFLVMALLAGYMGWGTWKLLREGKKFLQEKEGYLVLFFTLLGGLAFWFFKAPDFRFGYAYTVALYLISLGFLTETWMRRSAHPRRIWLGFAGLVLLFSLRPAQIGIKEYYYASKAARQYWLLAPGQAPAIPQSAVTAASGLSLYEATANDQCWDSPLPCTPFPYTGLELRDPAVGLASGFRIRQPDLQYYRHMQISYQPLTPEKKATHRAEARRE